MPSSKQDLSLTESKATSSTPNLPTNLVKLHTHIHTLVYTYYYLQNNFFILVCIDIHTCTLYKSTYHQYALTNMCICINPFKNTNTCTLNVDVFNVYAIVHAHTHTQKCVQKDNTHTCFCMYIFLQMFGLSAKAKGLRHLIRSGY